MYCSEQIYVQPNKHVFPSYAIRFFFILDSLGFLSAMPTYIFQLIALLIGSCWFYWKKGKR